MYYCHIGFDSLIENQYIGFDSLIENQLNQKQPGGWNSYLNCKMRKSYLSAMPQIMPNPKKIGEPLCMAYVLTRSKWQ